MKVPNPSPSKSRFNRLRRLFLWFSGTCLFIFLALFFAATPLLEPNRPTDAADIIIVMGGRPAIERALHAAELFNNGVAPFVLVTGKTDCQANKELLIQQGVPDDVIVSECQALDTKQNAELSLPILRQRQVSRAVIVTSRYHSRRALVSFRKVAADVEFFSVPARTPDLPVAYRTLVIFREYAKLVFGFVNK